MANKNHLKKLDQGKDAWNSWRKNNPQITPDLRGLNIAASTGGGGTTTDRTKLNVTLGGTPIGVKRLSNKYSGYDLSNTLLDGAKIFKKCNLASLNLKGASMKNCDFSNQDMIGLNLIGVDLTDSNLEGTKIINTDLSDSNLERVNLRRSVIINTDFSNSNLSDSKVFGISAWDLTLNGAKQNNISITQDDQPTITIDNLKVAQFVYLLINNSEIREVIDTVAKKAVLILGNFSDKRIKILYRIRDELRRFGYLPLLFDFDKPLSRDTTETVVTLAHMSRFIIADLSEQRSIPHELAHIIPQLEVPIKPIIINQIDGEEQFEYGMFKDFKKYNWVLATYRYDNEGQLIDDFEREIIKPSISYHKSR